MSEKERKLELVEGFERSKKLLKRINPEKIGDIHAEGETVSQWFERKDPSHEYPPHLPFDAFDRALLSAGIITQRDGVDAVEPSRLEDMRKNPDTRHLVGEWIARQYRKVAHNGKPAEFNDVRVMTSHDDILGTMLNQFQFPESLRTPQISAAVPVAELVSRTTPITNNHVKPYELNDIAPEDARATVGEGALIPHVEITRKEKEIYLPKEGIGVLSTYETLRRIPVDLLSILLQRIAVKNEATKVDKIVDTIVSGDGNANTAATVYTKTSLQGGLAGDAFNVRGYLRFKMKFKNPYALTHIIGQELNVLDLMLLDTGSANIPLNRAGSLFSSQQFTPVNQSLADNVRTAWLDSPPANNLIGIDKRFAVVRYFEVGSDIQEVTKWVEKQVEGLYMTENENYEIADPEATKSIDLSS